MKLTPKQSCSEQEGIEKKTWKKPQIKKLKIKTETRQLPPPNMNS